MVKTEYNGLEITDEKKEELRKDFKQALKNLKKAGIMYEVDIDFEHYLITFFTSEDIEGTVEYYAIFEYYNHYDNITGLMVYWEVFICEDESYFKTQKFDKINEKKSMPIGDCRALAERFREAGDFEGERMALALNNLVKCPNCKTIEDKAKFHLRDRHYECPKCNITFLDMTKVRTTPKSVVKEQKEVWLSYMLKGITYSINVFEKKKDCEKHIQELEQLGYSLISFGRYLVK